MRKKVIKLKLKTGDILIILTKDICSDKELTELSECLNSIDWNTTGWVVLPSEYIHKIKRLRIKRSNKR